MWKKYVEFKNQPISFCTRNSNLIKNIEIITKYARGTQRELRKQVEQGMTVREFKSCDVKTVCNLVAKHEKLKGIAHRKVPIREMLPKRNLISMVAIDRWGVVKSFRAVIIGDNGAMDFYAVSDTEAMSGSHLLMSAILDRLGTMRGVKFLDLGGVDPIDNRGVYDFKRSFGGCDHLSVIIRGRLLLG